MKIDIVSKNITLDEPLKVFIEEKIGGLDHFIAGPSSVHVEIGKPSQHPRAGITFYAEANLKLGGALLRAQATHRDLRSAIVDVKDELKGEIKKFKEKRTDLSRKPKK